MNSNDTRRMLQALEENRRQIMRQPAWSTRLPDDQNYSISVTKTAHGLSVGQCINFASAAALAGGTYTTGSPNVTDKYVAVVVQVTSANGFVAGIWGYFQLSSSYFDTGASIAPFVMNSSGFAVPRTDSSVSTLNPVYLRPLLTSFGSGNIVIYADDALFPPNFAVTVTQTGHGLSVGMALTFTTVASLLGGTYTLNPSLNLFTPIGVVVAVQSANQFTVGLWGYFNVAPSTFFDGSSIGQYVLNNSGVLIDLNTASAVTPSALRPIVYTMGAGNILVVGPPMNISALAKLYDVSFGSLADGDLISYSLANKNWRNIPAVLAFLGFSGGATITSSTTAVVPTGKTRLLICGKAGGGCGGSGGATTAAPSVQLAGAGGGEGSLQVAILPVTPGATINFVIGNGGSGGAAGGNTTAGISPSSTNLLQTLGGAAGVTTTPGTGGGDTSVSNGPIMIPGQAGQAPSIGSYSTNGTALTQIVMTPGRGGGCGADIVTSPHNGQGGIGGVPGVGGSPGASGYIYYAFA